MRSGTGHHQGIAPVDLAAQCSGLLNDAEDGHNGVVPEDLVPGGGEAGHDQWVKMGLRKVGVAIVHELDGGDGDDVANRQAIDGPAEERSEKAAFG